MAREKPTTVAADLRGTATRLERLNADLAPALRVEIEGPVRPLREQADTRTPVRGE